MAVSTCALFFDFDNVFIGLFDIDPSAAIRFAQERTTGSAGWRPAAKRSDATSWSAAAT